MASPGRAAETQSTAQHVVVLLLLAAVYWLVSQLAAGIALNAGSAPIARLQTSLGWPQQMRPVLLSAFEELILIVGSLPFAGIVALTTARRRFAHAMLVTLPAVLWMLVDLARMATSGLPLATAVYGMVAVDALKLLLTLPLLTLPAARVLRHRRR